MSEQITTIVQTNDHIESLDSSHKRGRRIGSTNLHSKHPSGIAKRLKDAGLDWVQDLAAAIKSNNETRINMWIRLLPYLVVTGSRTRVKRFKGRASKAAIAALEELENE